MELNLDLPIFVIYVNIDKLNGHVSPRVVIERFASLFNFPNVNTIYLPTKYGDNRIEVLWKGKYESNDDFLKYSSSILDIISDKTISEEDMVEKIREFKIGCIID